ncbi:hypothetical protein RFI_30919, partial [Reticulomyxa filosa]
MKQNATQWTKKENGKSLQRLSLDDGDGNGNAANTAQFWQDKYRQVCSENESLKQELKIARFNIDELKANVLKYTSAFVHFLVQQQQNAQSQQEKWDAIQKEQQDYQSNLQELRTQIETLTQKHLENDTT